MESVELTHNVASNEEEAMDYEYHTKVLYWSYEIVNAWMIVAGIILYNLYPNQIYNGWWAVQCPVTAYTTASAGTSGAIER